MGRTTSNVFVFLVAHVSTSDSNKDMNDSMNKLVSNLVERTLRALCSHCDLELDEMPLGKPHPKNNCTDGTEVHCQTEATSTGLLSAGLARLMRMDSEFPIDLSSQLKRSCQIEHFMRFFSSFGAVQPVATIHVSGVEQRYENGFSGEGFASARQLSLELLRRTGTHQECMVGAIVEVAGLTVQVDLNGCKGEIKEHNGAMGKYAVLFEGPTKKSIMCKPGNLVLLRPAPDSAVTHAETKALAALLACNAANLNVSINVHTCMNCHEFFKSTSLLFGHRIQLHQPKLTHTFINGCCSCNGDASTQLRFQSDSIHAVFGDILNGTDWVSKEVVVKNGRHAAPPLRLDNNGFELIVDRRELPDYFDEYAVVSEYYKECERLIQKVTNASLVKAFDHNRRTSGKNAGKVIQGGKPVQMYAQFVHADYTASSGIDPFRWLLNAGLSEYTHVPMENRPLIQEALDGQRRYAIVNVWRPFSAVERMPLACLDSATIEAEDLIKMQGTGHNTGSIYIAKHRQRHQWYYFPRMTPDEVILVKTWDSHGSLSQHPSASTGTSTFSLHSAFVDPFSTPNAPERDSIEVRVAIVY